jgi:hypothetical protein
MRKLGPVSVDTAPLVAMAVRTALLAIVALVPGLGRPAVTLAAYDDVRLASLEGSTSDAARRDALRGIPLEKLDFAARRKVESVLANVSIYRRMPARMIECDPELYLFLVRHPDVVVNIWELMKISRLEMRQTGPERFQISEASGTVADAEILYSSGDTHLVYGEGVYHGPLFARAVRGRGLLLLKTAYSRDSEGRCYVTCRLDSFVSIEPMAIELLTKTIQPIVGRTSDNNFVQTVNFVGSLSRTIETNSRGVQRLAGRLEHVSPAVRSQFAGLAARLAEKNAALARPARAEVAERPIEIRER